MDEQTATALLEQLKNGEIEECLVRKEDFLEFRKVLIKRPDFKRFRGSALRGGDIKYTYTKEPRS
jgi:hypothetical protein